MRKTIALAAVALAGCIAASSIGAAESGGAYAGLGVGEATNESGEFKGSDTLFKLVGGYSFNKYFAVEVARESESDSDESPAYGVGIELAVWRGLRLRGEYELVDVNEGDFDMVSVGAVYKF